MSHVASLENEKLNVPSMKSKFILLTALLLFARGCDIYSTSLWIFDHPSDEMNPLSRLFGFDWRILFLFNLLLTGLVVYAFYYYSFRYVMPTLSSHPEKLTDFVSALYFNEKGKIHQLLYKMPENKNVWIAHSGYVLVRVIILASFLVTMHNLCQYYEIPVYNTYREIVKRPLWIIYALILLSFVFFSYRLWKNEQQVYKSRFVIDPH